MIRNEVLITTILDNAGIKGGMDVLDVACGTGVLFPDYLKRGVGSVTGIDISPEMAKLAAAKFPEVRVICGDVEETEFDKLFDAVMVYNAFPHFPGPARLIETLARVVKPLNLKKLLSDLFGEVPQEIIVAEPRYFKNFKEVFNQDTFEMYKSWAYVLTLMGSCSLLSEELRGRLQSEVQHPK